MSGKDNEGKKNNISSKIKNNRNARQYQPIPSSHGVINTLLSMVANEKHTDKPFAGLIVSELKRLLNFEDYMLLSIKQIRQELMRRGEEGDGDTDQKGNYPDANGDSSSMMHDGDGDDIFVMVQEGESDCTDGKTVTYK